MLNPSHLFKRPVSDYSLNTVSTHPPSVMAEQESARAAADGRRATHTYRTKNEILIDVGTVIHGMMTDETAGNTVGDNKHLPSVL